MRRKTKTCKRCGIEFDSEYLSCYCKDCLSQTNKKAMQKFYEDNEDWRKKLKWRERLTLIKVKIPTQEKWNEGYNPSVTYDRCAYCKELHYEDQIYRHPYMKEAEVYGLSLDNLEELIDDIKKEIREGETTQKALERRGLDIKTIIEEELK